MFMQERFVNSLLVATFTLLIGLFFITIGGLLVCLYKNITETFTAEKSSIKVNPVPEQHQKIRFEQRRREDLQAKIMRDPIRKTMAAKQALQDEMDERTRFNQDEN